MKLNDLVGLPRNLSTYKVSMYGTYTTLGGQQCNVLIGSPTVKSTKGKNILLEPSASPCTLGALIKSIGKKSLSTPIYIESTSHAALDHAYLSINNRTKRVSILASY